MKKTNIILIFGLLGTLFSCEQKKRTHLQSRFLLPTCSLANVQSCVTQCEIVNSARNTAIQQEISSGLNLSNFTVAACAGQFEPIYTCYLQNLGSNACATLDSIIGTQNFKLVLENPRCQCSTVFS